VLGDKMKHVLFVLACIFAGLSILYPTALVPFVVFLAVHILDYTKIIYKEIKDIKEDRIKLKEATDKIVQLEAKIKLVDSDVTRLASGNAWRA
jgi:hypothetical protein